MSTVSMNIHFPGYEIIGEIGRSNARVLKARQIATGDLVAIKHFALNTDAETLRRFRLESQLMTDIRHPNVVPVREVQLDMPMPFIVMEWVEGGSLRTLLTEGGQLDTPTTIRLGQQMAGAFNAIHPRGIIHRDIKPENILYRPLPSGELHFLLTDFGVARIREQSQTMTGQSLMTYEYASPEQFDDPKGVDVATDYYSLGVVLYECLSGRVPFALADSAGMAAFMNQVLRSVPPPVVPAPGQYLPPSLDTLINWTLTKDPAQRLSDVNELVLLLGQANVEQLQAGRSSDRPGPVVAQSRTRPAPRPSVQPLGPQPFVRQPGVDSPGVEQPGEVLIEDEPEAGSNGWIIALAILVVAGLIGGAVFYKNKQRSSGAVVTQDSTLTMPDSLDTDLMTEDTTSASDEYRTDEEPADSTMNTTSGTPTTTVESTTSVPSVITPDSTKTAVDSTGINH